MPASTLSTTNKTTRGTTPRVFHRVEQPQPHQLAEARSTWPDQAQIRLGVAVRLIGQPNLGPLVARGQHLSQGLIGLRDRLGYLARHQIRLYRMADPFDRHANPFAEVSECAPLLSQLANQIAAYDLRLSIHLDPSLPLAVDQPSQAAEALTKVEALSQLLAGLAAASAPRNQPLLIAHLNRNDGHGPALFAARYAALSPLARRYLVLEHQLSGPCLADLLRLHERCGVPIVFDTLHHSLDRRAPIPFATALGLALATWPTALRPKAHLSSARSEAHLQFGPDQRAQIIAPRHGQHADFIAEHDLLSLLDAARPLPGFDLMIEAKASDLALLRLREQFVNHPLGGRLG